ncbi:MAG: type VI secretion system tip protein TssI/VgrG, partial [Acidobacteriota bacterium]
MDIVQKDRILRLSTPLGIDFLLPESFSAKEGLSELFTYHMYVLHETGDDTAGTEPHVIEPESLLGKGVIIELSQPDETVRYFHGICSRLSQGIRNRRFTQYKMEVVPQIWLLTHRQNSRIFQRKNTPDILKKVFDGFKTEFKLKKVYEPRNYCVQYRESDFDFASRLMEEEGIFYFFKHDDVDHTMVIADTEDAHTDCSKEEIPFFMKVEGEAFQGHIESWDIDYVLQTGKVAFWDHNFQLHTQKIEVEKQSITPVALSRKLELYDFPGGYARRYDGISAGGGEQAAELSKVFPERTKKAETMIGMLDAQFKTVKGDGACTALAAGYRFTLKNHPSPPVNGKYVVKTIIHEIDQSPSYITDNEPLSAYRNEFVCIPWGGGAPTYRPPLKTPKPIVRGSQTAIVVGPGGEEIMTDKYGRVKVQFHWDREGKYNEDSSCWVRVAHTWAGGNWGAMSIPRIGMETVVSFMEGDPDQPIITGCVYNPNAMPPYTLPDHKTRSGIKSNSTPGGNGFNEIRFEDKAGQEQIFVNAQKNQDVRVGKDYFEIVKNEKHSIVESNEFYKTGGNQDSSVSGNVKEKVGGSVSSDIGASKDEKVGMKSAVEAGMEIHLKAGMKVVIEAGMQLTLKGPGGFIDIGPTGVTVQGTMVLINSGGAAGSGSGCSTSTPKAPTEADKADSGKKTKPATPPPAPPKQDTPPSAAMKAAANKGTPMVGNTSPGGGAPPPGTPPSPAQTPEAGNAGADAAQSPAESSNAGVESAKSSDQG